MVQVRRVQTGVRIEASLLKMLKGLAAHKDIGLGDLIEGICLHALEGKQPFAGETLQKIAQLRQVYGLRLSAADSHQLVEVPKSRRPLRSEPALKRRNLSPRR